ncbi:hypothetical protein KAE78_05240 [Microbacterium sp. NIBRBAC000506063]|nr:hypothetical protein KAE78_05240 [Microbacterium sp. NIBRBAC000506063]
MTPEQVGVEVRLPEENLGPFTAEPEFDESAGEYTASVAMPVAGEWRMQVTARIDTYTEPIAIIPITIG